MSEPAPKDERFHSEPIGNQLCNVTFGGIQIAVELGDGSHAHDFDCRPYGKIAVFIDIMDDTRHPIAQRPVLLPCEGLHGFGVRHRVLKVTVIFMCDRAAFHSHMVSEKRARLDLDGTDDALNPIPQLTIELIGLPYVIERGTRSEASILLEVSQ